MWHLAKNQGLELSTKLPTVVEFSTECQTGQHQVSESFTIFVQEQQISKQLMQMFCDDPEIKRQFASVKAYWGIDDSTTMMLVGKGIADITKVKQNVMGALAATRTHGYEAIASYPDYTAYLIAMNEKPELTKQYLLDKTIGLLNYPTSRSGHIAPKQLFSDLGLSFEKMQIVYASSHDELRDLLSTGKVDIISSYWQQEDHNRFSKDYAAQIKRGLAGNTWYLKMHKNNTRLYCAAQKILAEYSVKQPLHYYSKLKLLHPENCQ